MPEPRQQASKPATRGDFRAEVADRAGGLVSNVNTLLELLQVAPDRDTAAILPESGIRVTYGSLREQVLTMADALAAAGIERGHRVAIVLPNGLPSIVSFLAASIAGTAAPLNSGYRQEEFSFYLEDTAARVLLCPPDGAEEARKAAAGKVPVHAVQMDETGFVRIVDAAPGTAFAQRPQRRAAAARRYRARPAHQRQHGPAQARAPPPQESGGVGPQHREDLRPFAE